MGEFQQKVGRPCPAPKCDRARKFEHAFCRHHWAMVPKNIQMEIWKTSKGRRWLEWGTAMDWAKAAIHTAEHQIKETTPHEKN